MSAEVTEESDPSTTIFPAGRTCVLLAESKKYFRLGLFVQRASPLRPVVWSLHFELH